MRILQVCLKPPYPKVDGGCMAIAAMTEAMLMEGHSVSLLCMSTHKHPFNTSKIPDGILTGTEMEAVEMDVRIRPMDAFLNLFSSGSYNITRFYSTAFENRLISIIDNDKFDIVLLESIFCTPYLRVIRENTKAKVIVRTHNVEFRIWEQLAQQETGPLRKLYLKFLAKRLSTFEINTLKQVDGIIAITEEDSLEFENMEVGCPIRITPIGFDVQNISPVILNTDKVSIYHIGAMDWQPNIDGVTWFLDNVWNRITKEFPEIYCHLAGRNMPKRLLGRSKGNLKISGEVDSIEAFISDKNVAVVPLRSGSGMRVKIVEALTQGKVVITTSIGATGIPFTDGENILIANTPDQFVQKVWMLQKAPELITRIGKNARKLAEEKFDLEKLSTELTYFYENL